MPENLRAAVILAAWCALRFGESTEPRRGDVTDDDGTLLITVSRAVTKIKGEFIVGPPKSAAGVRTVALPAALAEPVREHLERYVAPSDDALLFPAAGGGHLNQSTFTRF